MKSNKFDLIVTFPFYNEEQTLPSLLDSLYFSKQDKYKYCLVLVNHRSTDNSESIINSYKNKFEELIILSEDFPINCGGVPRNKGINYSINLAKSLGYPIPIATIDSDTEVSMYFGEEIIDKLNHKYDIVVFAERYKPKILLNWVKNNRSAIKSLIGLNWVRYQFLWALILSDIPETRGPGGYAMLAETFKKIGHKQPFGPNGEPITGENNRLGIIANRYGLKTYASPYITLVDSRRELSTLDNDSKGYKSGNDKSEIFKLARNINSNICLSEEEWNNYLDKGIWRTTRMVLIRGICYQKVDQLQWWFSNSTWQKIISLANSYIKKIKPTNNELEIVGNAIFTNMFDYVMENLSLKEKENFIFFIKNSLPTNNKLVVWCHNQNSIITPDSDLIKQLLDKFQNKYELKRI